MFSPKTKTADDSTRKDQDLTVLKQDSEFLEGKFQGLPEERRIFFFKIPESALLRFFLATVAVALIILAVFFSFQRLIGNRITSGQPFELDPSPAVTSGPGPAADSTPEAILTTLSVGRRSNFRIEEKDQLSQVVFTDNLSGEDKVLREYSTPDRGPARRLLLSPEGGFLAISIGTSMSGTIEVVNLADEQTIGVLVEYGRFFWLKEGGLVFNTSQELSDPRPFEEGLGVSLATFDAGTGQVRVIKQADSHTDYILERVDQEEIYFKKVVGSDPETWLELTETYWRINFDGNIEEKL